MKSSQLPLSSYAYCQLPMSFSGLTEQGPFLKKIRTCTFKEVKQSTLYLVITARAGAGGASEAPAPQHACDTHLSPRCVCVSWRLPAASGPSRELIGSRSQPASASTGPSTVAGTPCTSSLIPTCTDADTDQLRENPVSSNAMKWQRT